MKGLLVLLEFKIDSICSIYLNDIFVLGWSFHQQGVCLNIKNHYLGPELPFDRRKVLNADPVDSHLERRNHLALDNLFEVEYVPDLTGLCHSKTMLKPFDAVIGKCFFGCLAESAIEHVAADQGAGPSFSSIAVHHNDVVC